MFELVALPVTDGDCFLVKDGVRRILIDGGKESQDSPPVADLLKPHLDKKFPRLDCLVCTHFDLDHLNGVLSVLNSDIVVDELWLPHDDSIACKSAISGLANALNEIRDSEFTPCPLAFGCRLAYAHANSPHHCRADDQKTVDIMQMQQHQKEQPYSNRLYISMYDCEQGVYHPLIRKPSTGEWYMPLEMDQWGKYCDDNIEHLRSSFINFDDANNKHISFDQMIESGLKEKECFGLGHCRFAGETPWQYNLPKSLSLSKYEPTTIESYAKCPYTREFLKVCYLSELDTMLIDMDPLFSLVKAEGEIEKLKPNYVPIRYFEYTQKLSHKNIYKASFGLWALNSVPVKLKIKKRALMKLMYSLTEINRKSLIFLYKETALFCADSNLSKTTDKQIKKMTSAAKMITAPHHGSEKNKSAYKKLNPEAYYVRSGRLTEKRPGPSYLSMKHKYCTICRGSKRTEPVEVVLQVDKDRISTEAEPCSCTI